MTCPKQSSSNTSRNNQSSIPANGITLEVRFPNFETIKFIIGRTLRFQRLFQFYCDKFNLDINVMLFKFNGNILSDSDSVDSLGMKNNDVINASQIQITHHDNIP